MLSALAIRLYKGRSGWEHFPEKQGTGELAATRQCQPRVEGEHQEAARAGTGFSASPPVSRFPPGICGGREPGA